MALAATGVVGVGAGPVVDDDELDDVATAALGCSLLALEVAGAPSGGEADPPQAARTADSAMMQRTCLSSADTIDGVDVDVAGRRPMLLFGSFICTSPDGAAGPQKGFRKFTKCTPSRQVRTESAAHRSRASFQR